MSGYVYFIRGSGNRVKIGYSQNPAQRFRSHVRGKTKALLGSVKFIGCVPGTLEDEKVALSHFSRVVRGEIRLGSVSIKSIFPNRPILPLDAFSIPPHDPNVAIDAEVHDALVEVSARTGVKIKVLVEKALRKAYPVKNGAKRAEARAK